MEEALSKLEETNRLKKTAPAKNGKAKSQTRRPTSKSTTRSACQEFAQSLRDSLDFLNSKGTEIAAATSTVAVGSKSNAVSPEWLMNLCSTVPSELSALQLSQAVLSACSGGNSDVIQMRLFEALGEGERAMEVLFELAPRGEEIGRTITSADLERYCGGEKVPDGETIVDLESERRAMLLQEARETASVAAIAKAVVENSGMNGNGNTHTVVRKSDKEAVKVAKQAAKRAAVAKQAAIDAGVLMESDDFGNSALAKELEEEAYYEKFGGATRLMNLLPEGTKEYHEKRGLPTGTEREWGDGYEKVVIPAAVKDPAQLHKRIRLEDVMNPKMRKAFAGTDSLNPMQSQVFEGAFHTQENLLICAPTGAGKTNVAMLSVLAHFRDKGILLDENDPYAAYQDIGEERNQASQVGKKIIYIAPMKALAQEVVEKFSSKLKALSLIVRELTGDMQLTRAEAESADIIVTTPEKWDVVTRKGGDGSLSQSCGLLIIDEVHLLADERGAVIESIMARLHRFVESSQRQVRVVALSATLPNYKDVAQFLRVDQTRGLYYFGPEHRPVPLEQTFIGITEKDYFRQNKKMNEECYKIVSDSLRRGYQVMVFVHSRKGTGDSAKAMAEIAMKKGELENLFVTKIDERDYSNRKDNKISPYSKYKDRVGKSKNKEVRDHFENGLGIHHAGMLRHDRKLTENMFADGAIKVLCCTATLAWGINLPAHTVVIKGTQVFSSEKGKMIDLSILDVMQIFGRAGRPQYDTSGEATLITAHSSFAHYLELLVQSTPIESNFIKQLSDHLNAEIVAGTVSNIAEASEWLTYTYLYVRMCKNPLAYGIPPDTLEHDPQLKAICTEKVEQAAKLLDERRMARYDSASGNLSNTDLGRVASHYYIEGESVATFNDMLGSDNQNLTDSDLIHVICCAHEFENVKVRKEELEEMDKLMNKTLPQKVCPITVKAPLEDSSGKSNLLLQAFISQERINSFTLISDTNYVASNAGRVSRSLFEMCLKRGMAAAAVKFLRLAKSVDKRVWWFQTPLRQFVDSKDIPPQVFRALESQAGSNAGYYDALDRILSLLDMHPKEVGSLLHWSKGGDKIQRYIRMLPRLEIECQVLPVTRKILRFKLTLTPTFRWESRWHGASEGFWVWVEDGENNRIYHHEYILLSRRNHPEPTAMEMIIPAFDPLPPQYFIRVVSDYWVGCEMIIPVSFQHLMLPELNMVYTNLMDLTPLPISALQEPKFEKIYPKIETFNPIQTQLFHVLYHTDLPVLLGAPTGSGKTMVAEVALLRMKRTKPQSKCVYIAPMKSLAKERLKEWRKKFGSAPLNWKILELSGDTHHDANTLNRADVLVCTPEKWDLITRGWRGASRNGGNATLNSAKMFIKNIGLLIIDEIHLLGEERGAVLEAIVSRTRYISKVVQDEKNQKSLIQNSTGKKSAVSESNGKEPEMTRIVGLSTALANPKDLADWMGIEVDGYGAKSNVGLYNFRPSVRPIPMEVHIQGFPGRHYCPRMATMNKPIYAAIKQHSPSKPVIIFVASRRQTRLTALDLISYAAGDEQSRTFLGCDDEFIQSVTSTINDDSLQHTLTFGVGLHHAGLSTHDRETVEQMFLDGNIQILVATATLAWGVNLPAHLVIVKGTEFFDGKTCKYVDYPVTDVLQMMGRAGRPQFDTLGIACVMVAEDKKNFYKKFLYDPFPVESCLNERICENLNAEIAGGTINSMNDALGYVEWTYYARRVRRNPSFYGAEVKNDEDLNDFFVDRVKETVSRLEENNCVVTDNDHDCEIKPTVLGRAASEFYLQYRTPLQMRDGTRKVRKQMMELFNNLENPKEGKERDDGATNVGSSEKRCHYWLPTGIENGALAQILSELSKTHEYDELPVRHNEEHLNMELCKLVPWGANALGAFGGHGRQSDSDIELMKEPHTKCYLLMQAFLVRAKLPISDYINDTRTVMDQAPRLLAAMQFVSLDDITSHGSFDLFCMFSKVRQVLETRQMANENPLNQIPGIDSDNSHRLKLKGSSDDKSVSLRELRCMERPKSLNLLKTLLSGKRKNNSLVESAVSFLYRLPLISANNVRINCECEKSTGNSIGYLNFDLSIEVDVRNRGRRDNDDKETKLAVAIGTPQGRCLLAHKNVSIVIGNKNGHQVVRRAIKIGFDWKSANAGGGSGGGLILLRILCENKRGMDLEQTVPLMQT